MIDRKIFVSDVKRSFLSWAPIFLHSYITPYLIFLSSFSHTRLLFLIHSLIIDHFIHSFIHSLFIYLFLPIHDFFTDWQNNHCELFKVKATFGGE